MGKISVEKLFSYGTLQDKKVQLETFGRELSGQKDFLPNYIVSTVEIKDESVIKISGTNIHPILKKTDNPEDLITGTVFEISAEELLQADSYEVEEYKRVSATLKSGVTSWIYADARD